MLPDLSGASWLLRMISASGWCLRNSAERCLIPGYHAATGAAALIPSLNLDQPSQHRPGFS